ncbi:MAG: hypothetical protein PHD32_09420 [Eubacteriales bacterium]|nr:hypothetical protein [Eubacteriales bacterium]
MNYNTVWQKIEELTPLRFDCGRLCGLYCCQSDSPTGGMLLFPGEEAVYAAHPEMALHRIELEGFGQGVLLVCPGTCDRSIRPLACRLFPLAPALEDGKITCRLDARGRYICPLCRDDTEALDPAFIEAAKQTYAWLYEQPETRLFVEYLCRVSAPGGDPLSFP